MERLNENQPSQGFSASVLQAWGYLFVLLGIGAAFIQNSLLGVSGMTGQQLLELMEKTENGMILITASIVMEALESCAVPIFALLLVEGFLKTTDFKRLLGGIALVALVSEIPYNLAFSGQVLDLSSRNPAFGLVVALVLLWFFRYFDQKGGKTALMKTVITVAAVLWCGMLGVQHGTFMVLMVVVWLLIRNKPYKILIGALAAAAGCLISLYYVAAPIGVLSIHFYNGQEGEGNKALATYPLLLLAGVAASYVL